MKRFKAGVSAVLLAPAAMNKQAFTIKGKGNKVSMTCNNGSYSDAVFSDVELPELEVEVDFAVDEAA